MEKNGMRLAFINNAELQTQRANLLKQWELEMSSNPVNKQKADKLMARIESIDFILDGKIAKEFLYTYVENNQSIDKDMYPTLANSLPKDISFKRQINAIGERNLLPIADKRQTKIPFIDDLERSEIDNIAIPSDDELNVIEKRIAYALKNEKNFDKFAEMLQDIKRQPEMADKRMSDIFGRLVPKVIESDSTIPKKNIFFDYIESLCQPMLDKDKGEAAVPMAAFEIERRFNEVIEESILDILMEAINIFAQNAAEAKSGPKYEEISELCRRQFVFDPIKAIEQGSILKGFLAKRGIYDEVSMIENLLDMSTRFANEIYPEEEVLRLQKEKKLISDAVQTASAKVPQEIKDEIKEAPEKKSETSAGKLSKKAMKRLARQGK